MEKTKVNLNQLFQISDERAEEIYDRQLKHINGNGVCKIMQLCIGLNEQEKQYVCYRFGREEKKSLDELGIHPN
jgi:DNA-directed RNA polymerase sigma subunit (sigma70/sigma32)